MGSVGYNSPGISPFEGFWPQAKLQEGNTAPPINKNWIKDLLSMALPIRARPRFPHSQSLLPGSFHKPHHYPSEGRQNGNHNYRKLTKLITWITVLSNSMNHEPCCVGPPKTDGSWWSVLILSDSFDSNSKFPYDPTSKNRKYIIMFSEFQALRSSKLLCFVLMAIGLQLNSDSHMS